MKCTIMSVGAVVCLAASASAGVTAGWENIAANRTEVAPAKVVWRAPTAADAYRIEKRDGAEGTVTVADGVITVEKTNEAGMIVITAPAFATVSNQFLRFMADVHCDKGDYFYAQASLRAYGRKEFFDPDFPLEERFGYLGGADEMRGMVNQAPGMTNRKFVHLQAREAVATPAIIVYGAPSRTTWANWLADDLDAADLKWTGYFEARTARDRSDERIEEDEFDRQLAADTDHTACLKRVDGHTRLLIDGEIAYPSAYRAKGAFGKDILLETFAGGAVVREGMRLVVKGIAMGGSPGAADGLQRRYWTSKGFDAPGAVRDIKDSLRIVPDALCILSIGCNAYPDFTLKEHPDDVWVREDGSVVRGTSGSCVSTYHDMGMKDTNTWPWVSYASPAWREAIKANLRALVAELKRQGLSKRIVGLHLWGYHDGQFHSPYEDHSAMAKAEFERYLKEDALATRDYASYSKLLGFRAQEDFARTFKKALGKPSIAIRWNMGAFNGMPDLTAFAFSDAVDIIVPQPHYETRRPGMANEMILPYSSFDLHGKMYWNEFDLRTYAALESWASAGVVSTKGDGQMDDFAMWRSGYRKLAGMMLAHYSGYWFYDMGGGWFSAPEIAHDIGETLKGGLEILRQSPSSWRPDVALIGDESGFGSNHAVFYDIASRKNPILRAQLQLFAASGVPFEYFLAEDVLRDPAILGETKLLVLAGFRKIDDRRRTWLKQLADKGRTLVFLAESGINGGVAATGFDVTFSTNDFEHVIVPAAGVAVDDARGLMSSTYSRFWPYGKPIGPRGAIAETEGIRVLARYASDGAAAIAERREADCRRVYVAEYEALSPALFNRLAREAGAYVPVTGGGVQLNMNGNFISIHALRTGRFDFKLPFACDVINVKNKRREPTRDGVLPLQLTAGETCWFNLLPPAPARLADGDTLTLPPGEHHFWRHGSHRVWLDPSNNSSGWKQVAFPIFDKRNVTIDGNGATLIFHDGVFPFAATNSQNVTIRNLTIKTASSPCAVFTVTAKDDTGFEIEMVAGSSPARVVGGELEFDFEGDVMSTRKGYLSIHAVDRLRVHYLVTEHTPGDRAKYATTHMSVSVRDLGKGRIRFDYIGPAHSKETILPFTPGDRCMLPYAVGERCAINLTARRKQDALFFEDCDGVTVENVKIPQFGGMGLVAQRTGNIRISALEVLPEGDLGVTTTADIMHLINCHGKVLIENCRAGHSMDDVLNIHGNYLQVERVDGTTVRLRAMHHEQEGFFPYRPGDAVEFSEEHSREVVHKARVVSCRRDASDRYVCHLTIDGGAAALKPGLLVENATLNPDVTLRGNDFHHHPNVRLSGRGKYLIERNRFAHSRTALVVLDLAEYWYESGRVSDMTIRDNLFDDCNALGGDSFMNIGVSGWEGKPDAPKVHGTIRLQNNRYEHVRGKRWTVSGVQRFLPE